MIFEDFRMGVEFVFDFLAGSAFVVVGVVEVVEFMLDVPELRILVHYFRQLQSVLYL